MKKNATKLSRKICNNFKGIPKLLLLICRILKTVLTIQKNMIKF